MLATYAAKYRSLKAPRKLQWKPNLGTVQLELAIGDQTLEFNVSAGGEGAGVCVRGCVGVGGGGWGGGGGGLCTTYSRHLWALRCCCICCSWSASNPP
jgi:hypothetical protein